MMHRNRISIYVFVLSHRDLVSPNVLFLIFGNKKLILNAYTSTR
jgi:hypothetical protein